MAQTHFHPTAVDTACEILALRMPWLTLTTLMDLLVARGADMVEAHRVCALLKRKGLAQVRIRNVDDSRIAEPLRRPTSFNTEFVHGVVHRLRQCELRHTTPTRLVCMTSLLAGLYGQRAPHDLDLAQLQATLRLGQALLHRKKHSPSPLSGWALCPVDPRRQRQAVYATFQEFTDGPPIYCVAPLALDFGGAERLLQRLHSSRFKYEIW